MNWLFGVVIISMSVNMLLYWVFKSSTANRFLVYAAFLCVGLLYGLLLYWPEGDALGGLGWIVIVFPALLNMQLAYVLRKYGVM